MYLPLVHAYREWLNLVRDVRGLAFIFMSNTGRDRAEDHKDETLILRRIMQVCKETVLHPDKLIFQPVTDLEETIMSLQRVLEMSRALQRPENTSLKLQLQHTVSILEENLREYELSLLRQRRVYSTEEPLFMSSSGSLCQTDIEIARSSILQSCGDDSDLMKCLLDIFQNPEECTLVPLHGDRKRKRRNSRHTSPRTEYVSVYQLMRSVYGYCQSFSLDVDNKTIYDDCIRRFNECAHFIVEILAHAAVSRNEVAVLIMRSLLCEYGSIPSSSVTKKAHFLLFIGIVASSIVGLGLEASSDALEVTLWSISLLGILDFTSQQTEIVTSRLMTTTIERLSSNRDLAPLLVQRLSLCIRHIKSLGQVYVVDSRYTSFIGVDLCTYVSRSNYSGHPLVLLTLRLIRQCIHSCLRELHGTTEICQNYFRNRTIVLQTIRSISSIMSYAPDLLGSAVVESIIEFFSSSSNFPFLSRSAYFEYVSMQQILVDYDNFEEDKSISVWSKLLEALSTGDSYEDLNLNYIGIVEDVWVACKTWGIPISLILDYFTKLLDSSILAIDYAKLFGRCTKNLLSSHRRFRIIFGLVYLSGLQIDDIRNDMQEWTMNFFKTSPISAWIHITACFHFASSSASPCVLDPTSCNQVGRKVHAKLYLVLSSVQSSLSHVSEPTKLVAALIKMFLTPPLNSSQTPISPVHYEGETSHHQDFIQKEHALYDRIRTEGAETPLLALLLGGRVLYKSFSSTSELHEPPPSHQGRNHVVQYKVRSLIICRMVCSTMEFRNLARELIRSSGGMNHSLNMLISRQSSHKIQSLDCVFPLFRSRMESELYPAKSVPVYYVKDLCPTSLMIEVMLQADTDTVQRVKGLHGPESSGFLADYLGKTIASIHSSRCNVHYYEDDNNNEPDPRNDSFQVNTEWRNCAFCGTFSMSKDGAHVFSANAEILVAPLIVYSTRWHLKRMISLRPDWSLQISESDHNHQSSSASSSSTSFSLSDAASCINHFSYLLGCINLLSCVESSIFVESMAYIFDKAVVAKVLEMLNDKDETSFTPQKSLLFAWIAHCAGQMYRFMTETDSLEATIWISALPLYALASSCLLDTSGINIDVRLQQGLIQFVARFSDVLAKSLHDEYGIPLGEDVTLGTQFPNSVSFEHIEEFSLSNGISPKISEPENTDSFDLKLSFVVVGDRHVPDMYKRLTMTWACSENGLSRLSLRRIDKESLDIPRGEDTDVILDKCGDEMVLPTYSQIQSMNRMQAYLKQESYRQASRCEWSPFSESAIQLLFASRNSEASASLDTASMCTPQISSLLMLNSNSSSSTRKSNASPGGCLVKETNGSPLRRGNIYESPMRRPSSGPGLPGTVKSETSNLELIEDPPPIGEHVTPSQVLSSTEKMEKWRNKDVSSTDLAKKFGVSF